MNRMTAATLFVSLLATPSNEIAVAQTVSGTATTGGPCSSAGVGATVDNKQDCTFNTTKVYKTTKITRIYESNSFTLELSASQLDYIAEKVADLIWDKMQGQNPNIVTTQAQTSPQGTTTGDGNQSEPARTTPYTFQQTLLSTDASLGASTYLTESQLLARPSFALTNPSPSDQSTTTADISSALSTQYALSIGNTSTSQYLSSYQWTVASSSTAEQSIHFDPDSSLRIDTAAFKSSVLDLLSASGSPSDFRMTDSAVGLLSLNPDGSLEIKATQSSWIGSSIQFLSTSPLLPGRGAALDFSNGGFGSDMTSLQIASDGAIRLDGVTLKTGTAFPFFGADLPSISFGTSGANQADSFLPIQPSGIDWTRPAGETLGGFATQSQCPDRATLFVTTNGTIVPCVPNRVP